MAWIRQLPPNRDGVRLWAATVYTPTGRITESDPLKSVIKDWASDREAEVRQGDWIDPRAGDITVAAWWERCKNARHLEKASRRRDESHWRCHVEPKWGRVRVGSILQTDVEAWVNEMRQSHADDCADRKRCAGCKVGPATIEGALNLLIALFDQAIKAKMVRSNPARGVHRPPRAAHVDRIFDADEETELLERLDELFPGRCDARLFVELLIDVGLRWEEAAAIPRDLVDLRRGRIHIAYVMERDGTIREYAKSLAGNRTVGVGKDLMARLKPHVLAVPPGGEPHKDPECLIFKGPGRAHRADCKNRRKCDGCKVSPLLYPTWLRRVWGRALWLEEELPPAPRRPGQRGPTPRNVARRRYLAEPQPTPHDCRHTYGTRLADHSVPVHEIMALMGHGDMQSVQRYLHAGEDRFDRARQAMEQARGRRPVPKSDLGEQAR